jgi:hypothetical protein
VIILQLLNTNTHTNQARLLVPRNHTNSTTKVQIYLLPNYRTVATTVHPLSSVKLSMEHPARYALAGCKEKVQVTHERCECLPKIGRPDRHHADIAYCNERHLDQDTVDDGDTCTRRRWVRLVGRLRELYHLLFSIVPEKMSQIRASVLSRNGGFPGLHIVYRHMESAGPSAVSR